MNMATKALVRLSTPSAVLRNSILYKTKRFYAPSRKEKLDKQEARENVVFQYAGQERVDRIYLWGYCSTGALGIKEFLRPEGRGRPRARQMTPRRLGLFEDLQVKVKEIACGYGFTVYLGESKKQPLVYGTGINTDSQLGLQEYPKNSGRMLDYIIEPVPIELPTSSFSQDLKFERVGCGRAHTVIATNAGKILTLGNNAYGQCGRAIVENEVYRANPQINVVDFDEPIKQIVCGQDHTIVLTERGEIYTCGLGADGQTGLDSYHCTSELTLVKGDIKGEKIVSVSSASDTVLAVSENGDLFGWGNSEYSQLAQVTDSTQVNVPRHLSFKNIGKVTGAAAGGSICGLVNDKGEVHVWGFGILGKGPKLVQSPQPSLIPPPIFGLNEFNPDCKVKHIDCGINYFVALTNQNDLYSWGRNKTCVLGLGHELDQFFPFKVLIPAEVRKISCGVDHIVSMCKSFA